MDRRRVEGTTESDKAMGEIHRIQAGVRSNASCKIIELGGRVGLDWMARVRAGRSLLGGAQRDSEERCCL